MRRVLIVLIFQPRTEMASTSSKAKSKKRPRSESETEENEDTSTAADQRQEPDLDLSDTFSAILYLRSLLPSSQSTSTQKSQSRPLKSPNMVSLPQIVPVTMIYGVLSADPTNVDAEIARLAKENKVRRVILGTGTSEAQGSDAVMLTEDYWTWAGSRWKSLGGNEGDVELLEKLKAVLASRPAVELDRRTLLESLPCSDDDINAFVTCGLLTLPSRHGVVRVAVPGAASFSSSLSKGRNELLLLLRKRKFHEMLEQLIAQKGIKSSVLSYRLHIYELLGCGWVVRVRHPGGNVAVRCTPKGLAKISTVSERTEKKKGYRTVT